MAPSAAANQADAGTLQPRDAAGWLAFAASPTFTVMAWLALIDPHTSAFCSSRSAILPIGGMAAMYLLMSLFHLSPWLKLASGRRR